MRDFAAVVEKVEAAAEQAGRSGADPAPHIAVRKALERFNYAPVMARELHILNERYWMFYAAGVKEPDEAADVTIRRWRGEL